MKIQNIQINQLQRFLAIDLGMKRTGIASGNKLLLQATPRGTIKATGKQRLIEIKQQINLWQPDAIIVGVPFYPDGTEHEMTKQAQKLIRQLTEQTKLPIFAVDERYSTTEALASKAEDTDATSACIILQQFFNENFTNYQ